MHHYLISLSHPKLFLESVGLSIGDEKAVSTVLDVQTPQQTLDHTSPSRLDALVARGFPEGKEALLWGRDGDAANPRPASSLRVFHLCSYLLLQSHMCSHVFVSTLSLWCVALLLLFRDDDWKTCLKFAEEICMEQAWAWLFLCSHMEGRSWSGWSCHTEQGGTPGWAPVVTEKPYPLQLWVQCPRLCWLLLCFAFLHLECFLLFMGFQALLICASYKSLWMCPSGIVQPGAHVYM